MQSQEVSVNFHFSDYDIITSFDSKFYTWLGVVVGKDCPPSPTTPGTSGPHLVIVNEINIITRSGKTNLVNATLMCESMRPNNSFMRLDLPLPMRHFQHVPQYH